MKDKYDRGARVFILKKVQKVARLRELNEHVHDDFLVHHVLNILLERLKVSYSPSR